jgi:hypothetical protein
MGNVDLPQKNGVKYMGMHLDKSLALVKQKSSKPNKRAQLKSKTNAMSTRKKIITMNRKQKLPVRGIRTYGIELLQTASNYNIEILQRFQTKTLEFILNAPWYTIKDQDQSSSTNEHGALSNTSEIIYN